MPEHQTYQATADPAPSTVRIRPRIEAGILRAAVLTGSVARAEAGGDATAQANNRLANVTALNFRDYYIGRITDTDRAFRSVPAGSLRSAALETPLVH